MFPWGVDTGRESVSESENKIADEGKEEVSVAVDAMVETEVELEVESISISRLEFDSIFQKIWKQFSETVAWYEMRWFYELVFVYIW